MNESLVPVCEQSKQRDGIDVEGDEVEGNEADADDLTPQMLELKPGSH